MPGSRITQCKGKDARIKVMVSAVLLDVARTDVVYSRRRRWKAPRYMTLPLWRHDDEESDGPSRIVWVMRS